MPHITVDEANAWLEPTKLTLTTPTFSEPTSLALEESAVELIFSRLRLYTDTTIWTDEEDTPDLIRKLIAMMYVAYTYDKTYSDNADDNAYANRLRRAVDLAIEGIIEGTYQIEGVDIPTIGPPEFFPTDASSANPASIDSPSDGGPYFLMGTIW